MKNKRVIVHSIGYFQPELGYEEFFTAKNQLSTQDKVIVLCSDRVAKGIYPDFKKRLRDRGISHFDGLEVIRLRTVLEFYGDLIFTSGVYRELKRVKPDFVHVHTLTQPHSLMTAIFCRMLDIPYVIDHHDFFFKGHCCNPTKPSLFASIRCLEYHTFRKLLARFAIAGAKKIISVADVTRRHLEEFHKVSPDKISDVELGVDSELFHPDEAVESGSYNTEFTIAYIGNLTRRKKIETILSQFLTSENNWILKIVGDGDQAYIEELKKIVEEHPNGNRVEFCGYHSGEKLVHLYRNIDIAIWPFNNSVSIFEAMSCGCKVLVADLQLAAKAKRYGANLIPPESNWIKELEENFSGLKSPNIHAIHEDLSYRGNAQKLKKIYFDAWKS